MLALNMVLVFCMKKGKVCDKIAPQPRSGTAKLVIRVSKAAVMPMRV